MTTDAAPDKPSIIIHVASQGVDQTALRELTAGIEEEGVPCTVVPGQEQQAARLASQASVQSQLGVGIGLGHETICVHYSKLPADQPLFEAAVAAGSLEWRRCGCNAARLVKGMAFKEQPEAAAVMPAAADSQLYQLIRRIVVKMMQEGALVPGR